MILVDDRELVHRQEHKKIVNYLKSPYKVQRLEFGDLAFMGNGPDGPVSVGIERKRFRDLMDSINNGRLAGHQMYGLLNSYDFVYVLVEGVFKVGKDGYLRRPKGRKWVTMTLGTRPLSQKYLYNFLNELNIFLNVFVVFQPSIQRSGLWLDGVYEWWKKPWDKHSALNTFYEPPTPRTAFFTAPKLVVRIIKEIEGVGWEKAKAIGRKYPSIKAVMEASVKDLCEIPGIGKVLAGRILSDLKGGEQ